MVDDTENSNFSRYMKLSLEMRDNPEIDHIDQLLGLWSSMPEEEKAEALRRLAPGNTQ